MEKRALYSFWGMVFLLSTFVVIFVLTCELGIDRCVIITFLQADIAQESEKPSSPRSCLFAEQMTSSQIRFLLTLVQWWRLSLFLCWGALDRSS